ncbi:MAG: hypothetical protein WC027_02235 [Candidatus Paceibacterota bacterium]
MSNNLEKAFKSLGESESLDLLNSKILLRIDQERVKRLKRQSLITKFVGGLSFISFFPIFINLVSQMQNSGFWNYLSLLFTDTSIVMTYWKQFSMTLIETAPVFPLTLILVSLLGLSLSFKFGFIKKDLQKVGLSANYI